MTRVHVMLGDGGVGKTTLSAAYALALAERGGRVGLLSIDPARRMESALGLTVHDGAARVPVDGELWAAHLMPEATLRRWAFDELPEEEQRTRLSENRFFPLLADRLATTTDVIAALRMAEWLESDPSLTDLVVDTAPGRNGLELLVRPGALVQLTRGRAMSWVDHVASGGRGGSLMGGIGVRIMGGLARLGGSDVLRELADLFDALRPASHRAVGRLKLADAVLRGPSTTFLLVAAPRPDAERGARALCAALELQGVVPAAILVNRVVPAALAVELARVDAAALGAGGDVVRYARAYCDGQERALVQLRTLGVATRCVPAARELSGERRLAALTALGRRLLATS